MNSPNEERVSGDMQRKRVHLVKLCIGVQSVEALAIRQVAKSQASGLKRPEHLTRMRPKRTAELLNDGSLFWVIRGSILARQKILALETRECRDQITRCAIVLDNQIIRTSPSPRRAFQGWRYLDPESAPKDINHSTIRDDFLPNHVAVQLDRLGVI